MLDTLRVNEASCQRKWHVGIMQGLAIIFILVVLMWWLTSRKAIPPKRRFSSRSAGTKAKPGPITQAAIKAATKAAARAATIDPGKIDLSMLPERFVIFDLETTGLDPKRHEIIEIGAIKVDRDSEDHLSFQTLVIPNGRITARITEITGIDRTMVKRDGLPLEQALTLFRDFVETLPLVAYNSDFDEAFIQSACSRIEQKSFGNEFCCALRMARRAWPNRKGYRLADISRDGGLSLDDSHRALGDCKRTLTVYVAAARILNSYR
ncbi:3'-5' exonuclease [Novosphingobium sp. 1949]|uniref:3'-5' exonuclease n=1 Tax=Novosphingobium organovorum TaxID=2930092 RepID=A0ABT0BGI0_9SPHN|nr:3'-5' exonuclease [Novosphingobium organovorum]MCJ2184144.1 3'-5' exonuclease [Novosphingobium organovorum]